MAWALAASLVLHFALLWPGKSVQQRSDAPPPLTARLMPEEERVTPADSSPSMATQTAAASVPPQAPAPARVLQGRALAAALAALAHVEFYPRAAIERGLEGRVVLLLTLDAEGRVSAAEVAASSGHALLDTAAQTAALRIGRLPVTRRQVLLPVEFRLE